MATEECKPCLLARTPHGRATPKSTSMVHTCEGFRLASSAVSVYRPLVKDLRHCEEKGRNTGKWDADHCACSWSDD